MKGVCYFSPLNIRFILLEKYDGVILERLRDFLKIHIIIGRGARPPSLSSRGRSAPLPIT